MSIVSCFFLNLCYFIQMLKQNKLTKDAFDVIYIDEDLSELLIDSVPSTISKKRIDWTLNYFKDYVQVFNIKPTIKSMKAYYKIRNYMTWGGTPVQHFVQSMAKDLFDNPTIESTLENLVMNEFYVDHTGYWSLDARTPTLHPHLYDLNLFCSSFYPNKIPLELDLNTYNTAHRGDIREFYIKYRRYSDCYPKTIYGYPKQMEWRSSFTDMKPATIAFFKVVNGDTYELLSPLRVPFKNRDKWWTGFHPIFLPDGNEVISVEQTQEFFNRHS